MIWLGDATGRCVFLNQALRHYWGVTDCGSFDWTATLHPDDVAHLSAPYSRAMERRQPFTIEARYRRADGVWRVLRTEARPRHDGDGRFLGMIGVNTDVTDQQQTEIELRRSKEQLEYAIEAAGAVGTWIWDVRSDRVQADHATWCGTGAVDGRSTTGRLADFLDAIHPDDRDRIRADIARCVSDGTPYRAEYRILHGDGIRWFTALGRCERDGWGRPTIFAGVTVDVTDRRNREDAAVLLSRELSHRLKNIFGVLQVLTAQTARCHPDARPALDQLARRIQALGVAQMQSFPVADGAATAPAPSLRKLAERVLSPYSEDGRMLRWHGPDLRLSPDTAPTFALMLHELATNSAKYGSLSCNGQVAVVLSGDGTRLEWRETGGPPTLPPAREGFGTRLIRQSAASLGSSARWSWLPEGLLWELILPAGRVPLLDPGHQTDQIAGDIGL